MLSNIRCLPGWDLLYPLSGSTVWIYSLANEIVEILLVMSHVIISDPSLNTVHTDTWYYHQPQ